METPTVGLYISMSFVEVVGEDYPSCMSWFESTATQVYLTGRIEKEQKRNDPMEIVPVLQKALDKIKSLPMCENDKGPFVGKDSD